MNTPVDIYMSCNEKWCKHMDFDDLEITELSLQEEPDEVFMFWGEEQDDSAH